MSRQQPQQQQLERHPAPIEQVSSEQAREPGLAATPPGTAFAPPPAHPTHRSLRQGQLRRSQRSLGNQVVQRQLAAVVQRDGPEGGVAERPTREFFNYADVEQARANALSLFLRTQMLVQGGNQAIQGSRDKLMAANGVYEQAFARFEAVLTRARQEARTNERYYNIAIGVGVGVLASVLVAVGAAAVLPAAALEAGAFTGTWWAVQAGSAGASAVGGAVGGDLVARTGVGSEAGHDLMAPAALRPEAMQLPAWRSLADLQRTLLRFSGATTNLFLMHGAAEHALGEIRAHTSGGETETSESDLLDICTSLVVSSQALRPYETALETAIQQFARLSGAVAAAPAAGSVDEVERNIWIMWMAALPNDESDILDLDEIENYLAQIGLLGPSGSLGVDFGWYTSEDDERAALAAARRLNGELTTRYDRAPGT